MIVIIILKIGKIFPTNAEESIDFMNLLCYYWLRGDFYVNKF